MNIVSETLVPVSFSIAKRVVKGAVEAAQIELSEEEIGHWVEKESMQDDCFQFVFNRSSANSTVNVYRLAITMQSVPKNSTHLRCEFESTSNSVSEEFRQLVEHTMAALETSVV